MQGLWCICHIQQKFRFEISEISRAQWNGTCCARLLLFFRLLAALFCSKIYKREDFSSEVARVARAQVRNATLLLKYCRLKIFEQKRDCSKTNGSWKREIKERYLGQELCQMERDISVRLSEMTRPVKVEHHQSWSRIFRSDQTEICPFHLM